MGKESHPGVTCGSQQLQGVKIYWRVVRIYVSQYSESLYLYLLCMHVCFFCLLSFFVFWNLRLALVVVISALAGCPGGERYFVGGLPFFSFCLAFLLFSFHLLICFWVHWVVCCWSTARWFTSSLISVSDSDQLEVSATWLSCAWYICLAVYIEWYPRLS